MPLIPIPKDATPEEKKAITSKNIAKLIKEGRPKDQAVAIAKEHEREEAKRHQGKKAKMSFGELQAAPGGPGYRSVTGIPVAPEPIPKDKTPVGDLLKAIGEANTAISKLESLAKGASLKQEKLGDVQKTMKGLQALNDKLWEVRRNLNPDGVY